VNSFIITPFFLDQPAPALEHLTQPGWTLNRPAGAPGNMSVVHEALADRVARDVRAGNRPVSIAGDCCTAIGVMAGLQRAGLDPILVWLDAHGDFNTPESTVSGFIGGMPLAMMVGRGDLTLPRAVRLRPVAENDVFLCDARDLDPAEEALLEQSHVHHVPDLEKLPDRLPADRQLYVHFDPDVMNPEDAPAMLYTALGGARLDATHRVAERLAATGRVVAASLTVWQMSEDADRRTERACLSTLGRLVGEAFLQ